MTITATGLDLESARERRVPVGALIGAALHALRRRWRAALGLWIAATAANAAVEIALPWTAIGDPTLYPGGPHLVSVVQAVLGGIATVLALELFLSGRLFRRGDARRLVLCAAVVCAADLGLDAASLTLNLANRVPQPAGLLVALAMLALFFALLFAVVRLALWPPALLTGRPGATPAASWRAMRGATLAYVVGALAFNLPVVVLMVLCGSLNLIGPGAAPPWFTPLQQAVEAVGALATNAMTAVLYVSRLEAGARMAEAFD